MRYASNINSIDNDTPHHNLHAPPTPPIVTTSDSIGPIKNLLHRVDNIEVDIIVDIIVIFA